MRYRETKPGLFSFLFLEVFLNITIVKYCDLKVNVSSVNDVQRILPYLIVIFTTCHPSCDVAFLSLANQPTRHLYLPSFTTAAANGSILYTLILPVKPTPCQPTHLPLHSYGLDEIQTLCGSILKWPNSISRRAKWKVVKSFEPLLHYNSSKHIQLGPKFREDIKAPLHVTLEDDNS